MLAFELTDATNVVGAVGSGRASQGSSVPTRTRNSAGAPLTVAEKSNRQFHCSPPSAMSTHLLPVIVPVPISWLVSTSRTVTGAPTASPAVEPPRESAQPTHVPSARRTASAKGSVWGNGGPPGSTAPAVPATATPVTVPLGTVDAAEDVGAATVEVTSDDDGTSEDVVAVAESVVADAGGGDVGRVGVRASRSLEHAAATTITIPTSSTPRTRSSVPDRGGRAPVTPGAPRAGCGSGAAR